MPFEGAAVLIGEGAFFSPLQRLQRDLTIYCLRQHVRNRESAGKHNGLHICDALSGGGVRAIRYALEGYLDSLCSLRLFSRAKPFGG